MMTNLNNNNYIFHLQNNIITNKIYITNFHIITRDKISLYLHNNMITNLNNNNYIFHLQKNITTDKIYITNLHIITRVSLYLHNNMITDFVPAGWLDCPCTFTKIARPIVYVFVRVFLRPNTWNHKDKGRPRGCLHSDTQVSVGLGNTKVSCKNLSDENQIKEAFINGGRGHPLSHLKFFLLVFSKLKEDIK